MGKTKGQLADELFRLVERDQGMAFISDGTLPDRVFIMARLSLRYSERVVQKLKRWLKKHGELESKDTK